MKSIWFFLSFFVLFLVVAACECEDVQPTQPESPDPFYVTNAEIDDRLLFLDFNRPVNARTFIRDSTVFIDGLDSTRIFWFNDFRTVEISGMFTDCILLNDRFNCFVDVLLKADEEQGIRSQDDELLDGDFNGRAGGDFEASLQE